MPRGQRENSAILQKGSGGMLYVEQPIYTAAQESFSTQYRQFCNTQQYFSPEITLLDRTSPAVTRDTR